MRFQSVMCAIAIALKACSGGGGGDTMVDASAAADAKIWNDAPPVVPQTITISGKATETGLGGESPVAGVLIGVYANSNEATAVATATTNAQGDYSMTVTTNAQALEGFIKATKTGYVELYLYPTGAFIADTDGSLNMMTPGNKDLLNNFASGNQMAGKGLIGLQVRDANGNPVAGATVSSTPASGTYRYTGSNGYPNASATVTSADGVAFMFNVPPGNVTITASKAGTTFHAHQVKARADKFTTTSITP